MLVAITRIYIPIWLDLLYYKEEKIKEEINDLHSNMVRFIITSDVAWDKPLPKIYIPIWLDLL